MGSATEAAPKWRPRQVLRTLTVALCPRRLLLARGNSRGDRVYLTFDDGPHGEHTPAVLDALKRSGVAATFFVTGRNASNHTTLIRQMVEEGHALGHHSYSHSDPDATSAKQLIGEVQRTQQVLARTAARESSLFRPPHGKLTLGKLWTLWRHGLTVVLWNRDSKDYARGSAAELLEWMAARPLRAGDIVLMHDTNERVAQVLPELIARTRSRGLDFGTIPELIAAE